MGIRAQLLCAALVLAFFVPAAKAAGPTQPQLREELLQMSKRDQEVRTVVEKGNVSQADYSRWAAVDAANQKRLKQIVEQYGWPAASMVGTDGANAAWLLAQHADSDEAFQRRVLALMEPLVKTGEANAKDFAYLWDRTHYPQRYGTQGTCVSPNQWQPFEIEDIEHVEARRRDAGMPPLREYAALFTDLCSKVPIRPVSGRRTVPIP